MRVRIAGSGGPMADDNALKSLISELADTADARTEGDKISIDRDGAGCVLTFMTRDVDAFIARAGKAFTRSHLLPAVSVWIEDWANDLSTWREIRFSSATGD